MKTLEIRPPYYDPLPALLRRAGQALGVIVRFGPNGVYVIKRPSDETMKRLNNELKSA